MMAQQKQRLRMSGAGKGSEPHMTQWILIPQQQQQGMRSRPPATRQMQVLLAAALAGMETSSSSTAAAVSTYLQIATQMKSTMVQVSQGRTGSRASSSTAM